MPHLRIDPEVAELMAAQITRRLDGLVVADALHVLDQARLFITNTATFSHAWALATRELSDAEADEALRAFTGENFFQLARRFCVTELEVRRAIARRKHAAAPRANPAPPAPDVQG